MFIKLSYKLIKFNIFKYILKLYKDNFEFWKLFNDRTILLNNNGKSIIYYKQWIFLYKFTNIIKSTIQVPKILKNTKQTNLFKLSAGFNYMWKTLAYFVIFLNNLTF